MSSPLVLLLVLLAASFTTAATSPTWSRTAPFTTAASQISGMAFGNGRYVAFTAGTGFNLLIFSSNESAALTVPWTLVTVKGPDSSNGLQLLWLPSSSKFAILGWVSAITSPDGLTWTALPKYSNKLFIDPFQSFVLRGNIWSQEDGPGQPVVTTDLVHWTVASSCHFEVATTAAFCIYGSRPATSPPYFSAATETCGTLNLAFAGGSPVSFFAGVNQSVAVFPSSNDKVTTFFTSTDCADFQKVGLVASSARDFSLLAFLGNYYWASSAASDVWQTSRDLAQWSLWQPSPSSVRNIEFGLWFSAGPYVWIDNSPGEDLTPDYGLFYFSDDATTFSALPQAGPTFGLDVINYHGRLVMLDADGMLVSADGVNWTRTYSSSNQTITSNPLFPLRALNDELLVAGSLDLVSLDGVSWTDVQVVLGQAPAAPPPPPNCVVSGGASLISQAWGLGLTGTWVVSPTYEYTYCCNQNCEAQANEFASQIWFGNSTESLVLSSLNGLIDPSAEDIVIAGNSQILLVGVPSTSQGMVLYASTGGDEWKNISLPHLPGGSLDWIGNRFFMCEKSCYTSVDGFSWVPIATGVEGQGFLTIRYNFDAQIYYAFGGTGQGQYATSQHGVTWTLGVSVPVSATVVAVSGLASAVVALDAVSGSTWLQA